MNTRLYACFCWIFELFTDVLSLIYLDFGSKIIFISFSFIHEMVLGLKGFFCFVFLLTIPFVLLFVSGK